MVFFKDRYSGVFQGQVKWCFSRTGTVVFFKDRYSGVFQGQAQWCFSNFETFVDISVRLGLFRESRALESTGIKRRNIIFGV